MSESIRIDFVIVKCRGCLGERTIYPDRELVGAEDVHRWIQKGIPACTCGGALCDLKLHLVKPEAIES